MSDIPRTDQEAKDRMIVSFITNDTECGYCVPANFARQLERKLQNMTDQRDCALSTMRLMKANHEREIAEARDTIQFWSNLAALRLGQRDRLAEALRPFASFPIDSVMRHQKNIYGFDRWTMTTDHIHEAKEALAAVEGGNK
jgi:hypothetical protein